jgi:hypothetical protein
MPVSSTNDMKQVIAWAVAAVTAQRRTDNNCS